MKKVVGGWAEQPLYVMWCLWYKFFYFKDAAKNQVTKINKNFIRDSFMH